MKKVTRIIGAVCMMGLLTFVSTSCKKNQENGEATISVVVPGLVEEGERAYINANFQFVWNENDYIRVYNLADEENADESSTAVYTKVGTDANQTTARFRGPSLGIKQPNGYRYFHPVDMVKDNGNADSINSRLCNANRQVFQVSDHQQFEAYVAPGHHYSMVDGHAMPMATEVNKLTDQATLHHMFGSAAFLMRVDPEYNGDPIVVDSILLTDKFHNITGFVSLKLHKVIADDLAYVSNQYFDQYHGFTEDYVREVVVPALYGVPGGDDGLGWMPSVNGQEILLDCTYTHADGETKGEAVAMASNNSEFAFMLRPLALSEGFTLKVYLQNHAPLDLDETDFYRQSDNQQIPHDYSWATKVGTYKRYIMNSTLDTYLNK